IAATLDRVARDFADVALGSYPKLNDPEHRVKLTLESRVPERVEAALAALIAGLPPEAIVRVE
ncbi:MAG TPA: competence/damage-inducible protein A, partial [Vulgatibacter sp.]